MDFFIEHIHKVFENDHGYWLNKKNTEKGNAPFFSVKNIKWITDKNRYEERKCTICLNEKST